MIYTPFYIVFTLIAFIGVLELSSIRRTYKNVSFIAILVILIAFATMRSVGVGQNSFVGLIRQVIGVHEYLWIV